MSKSIHRPKMAEMPQAAYSSSWKLFRFSIGSSPLPVETLGDDVLVFLRRQAEDEYEVDDHDERCDDECRHAEGVVEARGDDVVGGLGRVAELLPLRLHGGVLSHAGPRLVGECDGGLAAAGEAEVDGSEEAGDDEREQEERVDELTELRLLGRLVRCLGHGFLLKP